MNNTLQNGFMLLEYLAAGADECSVKELAEHFKLPNSHVCRLLKTLTESGYLQQTPGSRKYRISLKIFCLSNARLRKLTLRQKAHGYLQKLAEKTETQVYLTAPFNGLSIVIDTFFPVVCADDAGLAIGQVHPVNRSACGKVCAAYVPEEQIDAFLAGVDWSARTAHTITSPEQFKLELAKVRRERIATVAEETSVGVGAVGAPIFNATGELAGAIGAVLPANALWPVKLWDKFKTETRSAAKSISIALGYELKY